MPPAITSGFLLIFLLFGQVSEIYRFVNLRRSYQARELCKSLESSVKADDAIYVHNLGGCTFHWYSRNSPINQARIFYPGKVIFFLVRDFDAAYRIYILGHFLLAAFWSYRLARHWHGSRSAADVMGPFATSAMTGARTSSAFASVITPGRRSLPVTVQRLY